MTFTKVTNTGIGSTGTVLLQNLDVIGIVTAGFGVSTVDVFTTGVSTFSGVTNITNTTDSTSSTTGALIVTGGVGIAASLNVGGSVSVGGTLTYEDVTNVDSVGLITARSGIRVTGVSTFIGNIHLDTDVGGENNKLLVGSNSSKNVDGRDAFLQVQGTSGNSSAVAIIRNSNNANGPHIDFAKSRSGSLGGNTVVQDGDALGAITFIGADGADMLSEAGRILCQVDGTPADDTSDMPGRLVFKTTADGSASATERLRITSAGKVGIGTEEPIGLLHLSATNGDCELILESDVGNDDEYDNPRIIFRQDGHSSQSSVGIGGTDDNSSIHNALTLKNSVSSSGGIIFMTNDTNGGIVPYQGHKEAVERLRIHTNGAIGLSGANYGSDNQVLTSKGSSSPPEWRGINTPAFDSYQSTAQTINSGDWIAISNLTETIDTNGAFSSSTFTVPTGGQGTYFIYGYATIDDVQAADYVYAGIGINGSDPTNARRGTVATGGASNVRESSVVQCMINLSVGDVIRLYVFHNEGDPEPTEPNYTRFGGYRLSV